MIYSTLSQLLEITRIPKLSSKQRQIAATLMKKLKSLAFSNHEIEILVGGKWKENTIKRYTRGVKTVSITERDAIIQTLSTFTSLGLTPQNVSDYLEIDRLLSSAGLTFDIVARFFATLREQGIDLTEMMDLQKKAKGSKYTIEQISNGYDNMEKLEALGLNTETLQKMLNEAEKYGGMEAFLTGISIFNSILELDEAQKKCKEDLKKLENETIKQNALAERQLAEAMTYKTYMDVAKMLLSEYHFDPISLSTLMEVVKQHGSPYQVLDAVKTYGNIQELKHTRLKKQAENQTLSDKIIENKAKLESMDSFMESAQRSIGEIQANQSKLLMLQQIYDLLSKPTEAIMEPDEFTRTSLLFLTGMSHYASRNQVSLPQWESNIKIHIDRAVQELTKSI